MTTTPGPALDVEEALTHWPIDSPVFDEPDAGLINHTWRVGEPPRAILQWVNPIFDARIHHDIEAVVGRLSSAGFVTPRLLPTRKGELFQLDPNGGTWRLLSYLPGRTVHRLDDIEQAREAGTLVGKFHAALDGWSHAFRAPRRNIHDTPARMAELRSALEGASEHPLGAESRDLGEEILALWDTWGGSLEQKERVCHGDLKISNLRFDTEGRATALLDLDTLGPMTLASELGDAWRSWCNPAGEDHLDLIHFRIDLFEASIRPWLRNGPSLDGEERDSLVPGIERISLELASRFCADAVRNDYFREDRERFPQPGAHNLLRARGQVRLARSARAASEECRRILRASF